MKSEIKDIKFINSFNIFINGDDFVKRKSFITELEHIINHIHFQITGYNVHIKGNICLRCGKIFKKEITSHHAFA